jgi:hypothetical protein
MDDHFPDRNCAVAVGNDLEGVSPVGETFCEGDGLQ